CAVLAGLLLLYAGTRVWQRYFWGEAGAAQRVALPRPMTVTTAVAVVLLLALALASGPVFRASQSVAEQLDGNRSYLAAVLPAADGAGERGAGLDGAAARED